MNVRVSRIGDGEIARRTVTDVRHYQKRCDPISDIISPLNLSNNGHDHPSIRRSACSTAQQPRRPHCHRQPHPRHGLWPSTNNLCVTENQMPVYVIVIASAIGNNASVRGIERESGRESGCLARLHNNNSNNNSNTTIASVNASLPPSWLCTPGICRQPAPPTPARTSPHRHPSPPP